MLSYKIIKGVDSKVNTSTFHTEKAFDILVIRLVNNYVRFTSNFSKMNS